MLEHVFDVNSWRGRPRVSPEMPLLVIDLRAERGRTVRVIAERLWSIENNLSISTMDVADEDGVFRGF